MKALSNSARKQAKKSFPKLPHSTRAFTNEDYQQLPKDNQK